MFKILTKNEEKPFFCVAVLSLSLFSASHTQFHVQFESECFDSFFNQESFFSSTHINKNLTFLMTMKVLLCNYVANTFDVLYNQFTLTQETPTLMLSRAAD